MALIRSPSLSVTVKRAMYTPGDTRPPLSPHRFHTTGPTT